MISQTINQSVSGQCFNFKYVRRPDGYHLFFNAALRAGPFCCTTWSAIYLGQIPMVSIP
jgi:hypothetical protein